MARAPRFPALILFLSGGCVMTIEIVAGRLLAPLLGVSLYSWTSVIGVVLGGMSLGNLLGGWLADRRASRLLLGRLLLGSSLATLTILSTNLSAYALPVGSSLPLYTLGVSAFIFLLPALLLGTIAPVVITLALGDLERAGETVGRLYAASAAGSIAGTLATGFLLFSWGGSRAILLGVAALLALLGAAAIDWEALDEGDHRSSTLATGTLLLACAFLVVTGYADSLCLRESRYFCINIVEEAREGEAPVQVLILDRLRHSTVDPARPESLAQGYAYEQIFAALVERFYPAGATARLDSLFIGGGGYNFPRYLEARYRAGAIDVLEIDPAVTQLAVERFGLQPGSRVRTINEDARLAIRRLPPEARYDIIFGDVFNDISVPYHLTTVEFNEELAARLRPDGLYLTNVIDGRHGHFLRAYIRTLRSRFPHLYLIPTEPTWRTDHRTTFVLVASPRPLPLEGAVGAKWSVLPAADLARFLAEAPAPLLRDDFVPTDNLLAPVFRETEGSGQ